MSINLLENKVDVEYIDYEEPASSEGQELYEEQVAGEGYGNDDSPAVDYSGLDLEGTIYKKAAKWVLLVGAVLVPLFFLPWTTSVLELNKQFLLAVVAGAGLVLWLLDVVMSGRISWRSNPLDKGVIAFVGAVALTSIFSMVGFKSVFGMANSLSDSLLTVAALTIIYLLVVNSFDDQGKALRSFFSISLAVGILYGLLQMFGVHVLSLFRYFDISAFDFTVARSFNTFGSVNALGMVSAIALPMLHRTKISIFRYFDISRVGSLAALAVLITINWWVLWIVAIAGMVSVVVLESIGRATNNERREGFKISKFLFPMTVMVLGIFLVIVNLNLVFVKNKIPTEIAPSYKLSWNIAWNVLQDNFAFGYGPENFSLAFDKYGAGELRNSTLSSVKFLDSTSQVLNVAVNNGLVGLAALGFLLWLLGVSIYRNINISKYKENGLSGEDVGIISAMVAGVVAMFFYPFNLVLSFVLYILLALLVLATWGNQRVMYNVEEKASLSLVSSLGFIGGLILALVGLYFVSINYVADTKYAKALTQTETVNALDYTVKAINWNGNDDRFYRLSSQLALTLLSKELNAQPVKNDNQKTNRIQNYVSSAVTLAQRATQSAPKEANNWNNLGSIYQNLIQLVDGADTLAEAAYLKASELRPGDPAFHNRIGNMYLTKADLLRRLATSSASSQQFNQQANAALIKAENAFKKAIEMSNNFGLAIYNLGSVYERQGKLNEAVKQLDKIMPFNSNQPGLAFELGLLYYRVGQKDKALNELQRAVLLSSDFANARWYLGLIYEERSNFNAAIEQMEKILSVEVNRNNPEVLSKLEQLKNGQKSIPPKKVTDQKPL